MKSNLREVRERGNGGRPRQIRDPFFPRQACTNGPVSSGLVRSGLVIKFRLGSFSPVQSGLVWSGSVRSGLIWFGPGQSSLLQSSPNPVQSSSVRFPFQSGLVQSVFGLTQFSPVRSVLVRSGWVRSSPVRFGLVWSGPVRSDPVQSGTVRSSQVRSVRSSWVWSSLVQTADPRSQTPERANTRAFPFGGRLTVSTFL